MPGHGAERPESELSGTMIHKQTIRLDLSNYVKYTADIPTGGEKSFQTHKHKHTHTHTQCCK